MMKKTYLVLPAFLLLLFPLRGEAVCTTLKCILEAGSGTPISDISKQAQDYVKQYQLQVTEKLTDIQSILEGTQKDMINMLPSVQDVKSKLPDIPSLPDGSIVSSTISNYIDQGAENMRDVIESQGEAFVNKYWREDQQSASSGGGSSSASGNSGSTSGSSSTSGNVGTTGGTSTTAGTAGTTTGTTGTTAGTTGTTAGTTGTASQAGVQASQTAENIVGSVSDKGINSTADTVDKNMSENAQNLIEREEKGGLKNETYARQMRMYEEQQAVIKNMARVLILKDQLEKLAKMVEELEDSLSVSTPNKYAGVILDSTQLQGTDKVSAIKENIAVRLVEYQLTMLLQQIWAFSLELQADQQLASIPSIRNIKTLTETFE